MAHVGLEEMGPALARIKASIEGRIHRPEVMVMAAVPRDNSSPPRGAESAFAEYDGPRGHRTESGTRLLFAAQCDEPTWWDKIDQAFAAEGFQPYGPRTPNGDPQVYQSARLASLVVEEHPGAVDSVKRTGKPMVGRIE
jgi:hypothetical protein